MAQLIRKWVLSCEQCIKESRIRSRIRNKLIRSSRQNPSQHITGPEEAMKIHLVPELLRSGCHQNNVKAMDVFSRYLVTYPTTNQVAKTVARVTINILTKHAYLPTTIISDKGSAFLSHVMKERADVPGITLEHSTTKHGLTIGMPERTHTSLKKAL